MRKHAQRLLKSKLIWNVISLYGVQACRKVIPLVAIPYLARVLGPTGWGNVAFAQTMGDFISTLIEFGFTLSATREIARRRDDLSACSSIMAGTLGAQVVLATIGITAALIAGPHVALLRDHPRLLYAGIAYGLAQGIAPLWFFQGIERMDLAAGLEITSKVLALAGILLFVHSTSDEWRVLFLQALSPTVTSIVGLTLAYRSVPFRLPNRELVRSAFKLGWPLFMMRSGIALYTSANVLILGFLAPPASVGYFASCEKIGKAITGLLQPVRDALYPRLSHTAVHAPSETSRLIRLGAIVSVSAGFVLSIGTFFTAPLIVHLLLGKGFDPAIIVLRIFALLPVVVALTESVGMQSLVPAGKERVVNKIILLGGAVNIGLAIVLAPRFHQSGMAVAVLAAETLVCITLITIVYRTTDVFRRSSLQSPSPISPEVLVHHPDDGK
jgi:polysaccharide transporter, PST family